MERMSWKRLLTPQRESMYNRGIPQPTDLRSEFEKDYHRIIGSASFRRLQDKTQVFPLDKSDFIRTRLTHSLEVSSLGKSLGQTIGESILAGGMDPEFTPGMRSDICHIVECAGLIHDIGNPPFGHFGETAIREWFSKNLSTLTVQGRPATELLSPQMQADLSHFEGNAQALRLVTKLHFLVDEHGMNLTYPLLNTIIKYPVSSTQIRPDSGNLKDKKMGYFYADRDLFCRVTKATGTGNRRHPLTYILEAADDLAYRTADIEDAFVKGYISYDLLYEAVAGCEKQWRETTGEEPDFDGTQKLARYRQRGKERGTHDANGYAIRNWLVRVQSYLIRCATEGFLSNYERIMEGTFRHDLFFAGYGEQLMKLLGSLAFRYVFSSKDIYRMEVTESVIIDFLMEKFVTAVLEFDEPDGMLTTNSRLMAFISDNYKAAYFRQKERMLAQADQDGLPPEGIKVYLKLLLVTDYICGMTDSYAKRLYQEMNGILS